MPYNSRDSITICTSTPLPTAKAPTIAKPAAVFPSNNPTKGLAPARSLRTTAVTTSTYRTMLTPTAAKIPLGKVRCASTTSSPMLAMVSNPMNAKKAMNAPAAMPPQPRGVEGIMPRMSKSGAAQNPAAIATISPPISNAPIAAASPTLAATPAMAMAVKEPIISVISSGTGNFTSTIRY